MINKLYLRMFTKAPRFLPCSLERLMIYLLYITRSPGKVKGANFSPPAHARANEDKLENVGPTFSSSVGDFGRLFLSF